MIEFKGEYSEKNKKLLIKQVLIVYTLASLAVFIIFGSIITGIAIYTKDWYLLLLLIILL